MEIDGLVNPDKNVRAQTALDVGLSDDSGATGALITALCIEPDFFVTEHLTWALVRMGRAAIEPLSALLREGDATARHRAAHVLSKIGGPETIEALLAALDDRDVNVLSKVAFALGQAGEPRALPGLVRLLAHESRDLQSTLATAFERFGRIAQPHLVEALGHPEWRAREQAAYLLGSIAGAEVVPVLATVAGDTHWEVRVAVAHALGEIHGDEAIAALSAMADDADARVRGMVDRALRAPRRRRRAE